MHPLILPIPVKSNHAKYPYEFAMNIIDDSHDIKSEYSDITNTKNNKK